MMYRTVLFKNPDTVHLPTGTDVSTWQTNMSNALSDFTTNHKSSVVVLNRLVVYDSEVDYTTFTSKIDGQTITWSDVSMFETPYAYYLFLEA